MPEPKFYTVPAGTRAAECNGKTCRATIYWVENPETSRRLPVDCDVNDSEEPTARDDGRGVSHFTTCPDVGQFSRSSR
jgi:hypothetical protein